jgi:hypothetical protein
MSLEVADRRSLPYFVPRQSRDCSLATQDRPPVRWRVVPRAIASDPGARLPLIIPSDRRWGYRWGSSLRLGKLLSVH